MNNNNNNWVFWVIGIGSILFMGIVLYINYTHASELGKDYQGLFGDMFGASNALFTGLSFTGVIIAILLQRQELKLQRKELELTREEMKLTRNEFETQNETLTKQQFENTFFQMLSMFNENTTNINLTRGGDLLIGKNIFNEFRHEIEQRIDIYVRKMIKDNPHFLTDFDTVFRETKDRITAEDYKNSFITVYNAYQNVLSNYFSTLHILLKFVDDSSNRQKDFYTSIIISQFSPVEVYILFIYNIQLPINSDFKILMDKYDVVQNLEMKFLTNKNVFLDYILDNKKEDNFTNYVKY